ncbi:class F sortase [Streptomyces katsurahamanus]|uniref:Class F sortase n=1 Tax=Streptomyces katsurahamanus TaxID=2577098 RepID=A0ABW9NT88_9ACTN|nr:class F sortase [Streptomyces katsurahamanus]MQS36460.1 class F sortase [Streptomyces katsurahamanus]
MAADPDPLHRPPGHPATRHSAWFTLLSALLLGVSLLRTGMEGSSGGPPRPAVAAVAAQPRTAAGTPPAVPGPLPHSPPRRIAVPSLGVNAPLTRVGLDARGRLQAPPETESGLAGWYANAAAPGERGTAVIVGHVDDAMGPAVFYPLGSIRRDSRIEILRDDGRTAVFTVYGVETHPLRSFPADRVYRDGPGPELRLITCGGRYTEGAGYDSNVVVFARLAEVRPPGRAAS